MTDRKLYVSDEIIERDTAEWWADNEAEDYSCRIYGDVTEIYDNTYGWTDDIGNVYIGTWENWQQGGCYNDVRYL